MLYPQHVKFLSRINAQPNNYYFTKYRKVTDKYIRTLLVISNGSSNYATAIYTVGNQ